MAGAQGSARSGGARMRHHFFITGTDTGVGKTVLSALLCAALDAVYWKPIQTGTLEGSDRVTVMRLAGIGTDRTLDEVYKFVPPVSPDLAARWAGVEIDLGRINMPGSLVNDWLIVEGAGGVLVPVNQKQFMLDLVVKFKLPVIVAARSALGTVNHTLLTLAALHADLGRRAGARQPETVHARPGGEIQIAGDCGGAQRAGHGQSHTADACRASRRGIAGAWRGANRRSEPREPRDHRTIWPRARDRRDSQASESAPHSAHAGLHESFRSRRLRTIVAARFVSTLPCSLSNR